MLTQICTNLFVTFRVQFVIIRVLLQKESQQDFWQDFLMRFAGFNVHYYIRYPGDSFL